MKRSEMINILRNAFIEHMNCVDCCKDDDMMYSKILQKLEDSGMVPPIHYPHTCYCSMSSRCPDCSPIEYTMYHRWEE